MKCSLQPLKERSIREPEMTNTILKSHRKAFILIKAVCVDGEKIETDKQFDLITSSMTLHWFENFKKHIKIHA